MRFKEYAQYQGNCLPFYLEDLIPEDDVVKVVNDFVDLLPQKLLASGFKSSKYNKGGNPPHHPAMMMKVLIYSYIREIYSCREIEKALQENVKFMWLTGQQFPDFRTINRFRGVYFKDILKQVFVELVMHLSERGFISLESFFVDGTKIIADSNKHQVVWKKNVSRYKERIANRVNILLEEISEIDKEELKRYGELELEKPEPEQEHKSENLTAASQKIAKALEVDGRSSNTDTGKKLRKAKKQLEDDAKKLAKYEQQEQELGERNSMSKTDKDASVMKTKKDEIRPAYNPQVVTDNSFIVGNTVSQNACDNADFIALLKDIEECGIKLPKEIVADAGYGSEANYNYLESKNIAAYIKYPFYYVESSKDAKYKYHCTRFKYCEDTDTFTCPRGKKLYFLKEEEKVNQFGFTSLLKKYRCSDCINCKAKSECTKSASARELTVNFELKRHREKARMMLKSKYGSDLYKRRAYEVETVFGEIKHNKKFERFSLRGIDKVTAEMNLLCIAFNLHKLSRVLARYFCFFVQYLAKLLHFLLFLGQFKQFCKCYQEYYEIAC
jgi:transposase